MGLDILHKMRVDGVCVFLGTWGYAVRVCFSLLSSDGKTLVMDCGEADYPYLKYLATEIDLEFPTHHKKDFWYVRFFYWVDCVQERTYLSTIFTTTVSLFTNANVICVVR